MVVIEQVPVVLGQREEAGGAGSREEAGGGEQVREERVISRRRQ